MGVVYMALQKEPVKRKVALKIIKPGMDTSEVVARFEAERFTETDRLMEKPDKVERIPPPILYMVFPGHGPSQTRA